MIKRACAVCGRRAPFLLEIDADEEQATLACGSHLPVLIKRLLAQHAHVTTSLA